MSFTGKATYAAGSTLPEIADDVAAYVGCIAGALQIDDYRQRLIAAGFADVLVLDAQADLNAYTKIKGQAACCSPAGSTSQVHTVLGDLLSRYDVNDYAASVKVYALKPR